MKFKKKLFELTAFDFQQVFVHSRETGKFEECFYEFKTPFPFLVDDFYSEDTYRNYEKEVGGFVVKEYTQKPDIEKFGVSRIGNPKRKLRWK